VGALAVVAAVAWDAPARAAGSWSPETSNTTSSLYGVSFVDATHGWSVGAGGTILATVDGGAHWSAQSSSLITDLHGVSFVDANHGWAVGAGGAIQNTVDGGARWIPQVSNTTNLLFGVSFVDANHGWVVGAGGTILATADGGASWTPQTSNTTSPLIGVCFLDANHGWAVGGGGTILATVDGGAHWAPQISNTINSLVGVSFVDTSHGWAAGANGALLGTVDGGAHWKPQTSNTTGELDGVSFVDANHGWVVGSAGTILATVDGGAHWSPEASSTTSPLIGVSFVDANHGWAVGFNGTVLGFVGTPGSGNMTSTPSSGPPGTLISVSSMTPCPVGASYATILLRDAAGRTLASGRAGSFSPSGAWGATLRVPTSAAAGSYSLTASCFEPAALGGVSDLQDYIRRGFAVTGFVPSLSGLQIAPKNFSIMGREVGGKCVKKTGANRNHKLCRRPIRLRVSYKLDAAVTVNFTLKHATPGRKVDGRCVKPTSKNSKRVKCMRLIRVGAIVVLSGKSGTNHFTLTEKIDSHSLSPGVYRLIATPSGGKSKNVTFEISA
jgi:photosystem II stability/assembly factor-like uncharacterized protein